MQKNIKYLLKAYIIYCIYGHKKLFINKNLLTDKIKLTC